MEELAITISTISTKITSTVTLGNGTYADDITITSAGSITVGQADAIVGSSAFIIDNQGHIFSDQIAIYTNHTGTLINSGAITGLEDSVDLAAGGTVFNSGTITGSNTSSDAIEAGGSLYIENSRQITGGEDAISAANVSFYNTGTIDGIGDYGVFANKLLTGTNGSHGLITGGYNGLLLNGGGFVLNDGTIHGGSNGLFLKAGGSIVNDGTIIGGSNAIDNVAGAFTLAVGAGAVFVGAVDDAAGTGVLSLSGTTAGSLDMGNSFSGFSEISFGSAHWSLSGTSADLADGQTITGFTLGDDIQLTGFSATTDTYISGVGLVLNDGVDPAITLDIQGTFQTGSFTVTQQADATFITLDNIMPCFAAGTRILTAAGGPVPVEALAVGDELALHGGGSAPIQWVGKRTVAPDAHTDPAAMRPVLIMKDALNNGLPERDLFVSPDHALFFEGHLIPAKTLINGHTVRQIPVRDVTYYHIELPRHAVLLAEGVAAESYLDTGNRCAFENGGTVVMLHPQFAQAKRETESCAPLVEEGAIVECVRRRILDRAEIETTPDAEMEICYQNGAAMIISRTAIPGETTADPRDRRVLGVKLGQLEIDGEVIALDHPALTEGWHAPEPDGRWTNGQAVIPAALLAGRKAIKVSLAATLRYPVSYVGAGSQRASRSKL